METVQGSLGNLDTTLYGWVINHHPHGSKTLVPGVGLRCECGAIFRTAPIADAETRRRIAEAYDMCTKPGQYKGYETLNTSPDPVAKDDRHAFASGAMSSGMKPRYDLIPTYALERMARRFAEGAAKYGENNWQKGVNDPAFIRDRINHAIEHLLILRDKVNFRTTNPGYVPVPPDDDAAAVILNAIFVMAFEEANR